MEISDKTITVQTMASDLAMALGATIPFAADVDYGVPGISAVQLRAGDGMLTASATNRYVLGHARQQATASEPVRFVLDVDDARHLRKRLSRAMKVASTGRIPVELTITGTDKRSLTARFGKHQPVTVTFGESHAASAPEFQPIFDDNLVKPGTIPAADPVGLTPVVLKPLIKAAKWGLKGEPLRWYFGEHMKPIRVEMGDWFLALVMPARIGDRAAPVEYAAPAVPAIESESDSDEPVIPTADQPAED